MDEGQPDQGPDPSVEIRVDLAPRITFATHHCGHPVLNELVVSNPLPDDLRDLTLTLSVHPEILGERVWRIECIPAGSEFRIPEAELSVPIADGILGQLDERLCVELRFELTQPGGDGNAAPLAGTSHRLEALPRDEWGGGDHMPDLLAAFVMPDDPAVYRLINRASHILALHGKTALDGYGSKPPGQVWEMLCGIWHATAAMNIDPEEIPSGFAAQGQRIHFPHVMETRGHAGSLDMALLFAGAMEQADLNPVVVLTQGHALAGAYLQPRNLPDLVVVDPMELRKAVQARELVIFDPAGAHKDRLTTFSAAIDAATGQMAEDREHEFAYALDIQRARDLGVRPLPPPTNPPPPPPEPRLTDIEIPWEGPPDYSDDPPQPGEDPPPKTPEERIERWKRSLLDLSRRNRLLNLRTSNSTIGILCPEPARLEDRLAQNESVKVVPIDPDLDDGGRRHFIDASWHERGEVVADVNDKDRFRDRMVNLYRKAKTEFEEGGSNTLFLALGMLRWSHKDGGKTSSCRAPLVLLPVKLHRSSAGSMPRLTHHDDDPVFNLTLIQLLHQKFEIDLSEFEDGLPEDDSGVDVPGVWETVRRKVRDVPGFEVTEEVVLSTFSFAKYLMWKDLADRTDDLKRSDFVRHLIDHPQEAYKSGAEFIEPHEVDERILPKDLLTPLNADASQIVAVHASAGDGDFVLEGPPGTGKSETIANIIAHNLGMGRRVLFVSEKMAALNVVHGRLSRHGLGPFCLELHSAKAHKRAVLDQLDTAWQERGMQDPGEWEAETRRLETLRDKLNNVVEALHEPGPSGQSPRKLIGRALRHRDDRHIQLDHDWGRGLDGNGYAPQTPRDLEDLRDLARRVGERFDAIEPEDRDVFATVTKTESTFAWRAQVTEEAKKLEAAIGEVRPRATGFLKTLAPEDTELGNDTAEIGALARIAGMVPDCAGTDIGFALADNGMETIRTLKCLLDRLDALRETLDALPFETDIVSQGIRQAPVPNWVAEREFAERLIGPLRWLSLLPLRLKMSAALLERPTTPVSAFIWRIHELFSALRMAKTEIPPLEDSLNTLTRFQGIQSEIERLEEDLPTGVATPWQGPRTDTANARQVMRTGGTLRRTVERFANLGGRPTDQIMSHITRVLGGGLEMSGPGEPVAEAATAFVDAYQNLEARLHDFQKSTCLNPTVIGFDDSIGDGATSKAGTEPPGMGTNSRSGVDLEALLRTTAFIVENPQRLIQWDRWVEERDQAVAKGIGAIVRELEDGWTIEESVEGAFETAYANWLAPKLLDQQEHLQAFDGKEHNSTIKRFRSQDRKVAQLAVSRIWETVCSQHPVPPYGGGDTPFDSPGFGILKKELAKKSHHLPVRRLIDEMQGSVLALTPCLMMSPLSVAQFLPASSQAFDLVVFDEASQITVPDAIGAIARGKRCIVVGDPKQLPPTSFFERSGGDYGNEEALDLESILDEALAARVPHRRLTGHYRSRHESLITFSNHTYYNGQLLTYPSAKTRDSMVSFRRIDGVWVKGTAQTNQEEAKAVVEEVVRRLQDPDLCQLSIGIVTMNSKQQRLIENLLDNERQKDDKLERFFTASQEVNPETPTPAPVFVKNLETVQGDERDVILLSMGYGPTELGSKAMSLNFGPLNKAGGERRLNVAITRATTEVIVFASFDASMIDLNRTRAKAMRDLRSYIDFANRGPIALGQAITSVGGTHDYESDFEMMVADQLRSRGWKVRTQVGVSKYRIDLGIVHPASPGDFLAGVECDGASYHSSPSARDRDRIRQMILEDEYGWRLLRVWSTDFFRTPEGAIKQVDDKLREFLDDDRKNPEAGESEDPTEGDGCPPTDE